MAKKKPATPRSTRRVSDTAIAVALGKTGGVLNAAAKLLKITRQSLSERIANNEELTKALQEAIDCTGDMMETNLIKAGKKGAGWAIKLYLTNKCRDRGYGQKLEISGSLNTGEVHVLELPDNGRDDSTDESDNEEDSNDEA